MQEPKCDVSAIEISLTISDSPGTHEELVSWTATLEENGMASVRHTLPVFQSRASNRTEARLSPTVFDNMSKLGEGLNERKEPRKISVPSRERESSGTPPPANMEDIEWYHFNISRHVAESILISTGEDGSYLLRDSATNPGEFTLSVRAKTAVKHFPVKWNGSEFTFGFGHFTSVHQLADHFASRPVIGGESGVLTLLKFPYPRYVEEPDTYDQIRVHAEWGNKIGSQQTQGSPTFAIASKEGYMTKQGYHRKSWRTRWFVLFKNELSYYKNREEKNALRTIDLTDVMDVVADCSQGKQNCFRMITSYRTFFFYTGSAQEAEEWIAILRWKLDHPKGTETAQRQNRM